MPRPAGCSIPPFRRYLSNRRGVLICRLGSQKMKGRNSQVRAL